MTAIGLPWAPVRLTVEKLGISLPQASLDRFRREETARILKDLQTSFRVVAGYSTDPRAPTIWEEHRAAL